MGTQKMTAYVLLALINMITTVKPNIWHAITSLPKKHGNTYKSNHTQKGDKNVTSILDEIQKIRFEETFSLDLTNRNRYRVVVQEPTGSKTAYYFGAPIYNERSRKLLNLKFDMQEDHSFFIGSNGVITLGHTVSFKNKAGNCEILFPGAYHVQSETCIEYDIAKISPTLNGIAVHVNLHAQSSYRFQLETHTTPYGIKHNKKYFSIMREKFVPFVIVSCIGGMDKHGNLVSPATVQYCQTKEGAYELTVNTEHPDATELLFEINLYEQKLFQDTTVESRTPDQNNAFGGTALIGYHDQLGEQWLYARPNFTMLRDLTHCTIREASLYFPKLNQKQPRLFAFPLSTRFCSFGSTWNTKKNIGRIGIPSVILPHYQKIDITPFITHQKKLWALSEGWVIRSVSNHSDFCAISTGDSSFAPPILAVQYE